MNRLLRSMFFCLAALLTIYTALFVNYVHGNEESWVKAKIVWVGLAVAIFFALAGWRFSLGSKFKILAVILSLLGVELLLQTAAWLGVLPAVNIAQKAPFARIYWTAEGRGNGIRNRFGWYYPPFDLKASHKIAFIGNSQVEGLEVLPWQNQAADLDKLLKEKSRDWAVLGFGSHGSCPAQAIDVLEYVWRHFRPQEAILVVTLGNDISAASAKLHPVPANQFIYYDLDERGDLLLNPASAPGREHFDRALERSHRSLFFNLPFILYSHCMTVQVADSLRDSLRRCRQRAEIKARGKGVLANGFNTSLFAVNPTPDAQLALKILLAQLRQCKKVCDSHGMKFRLVTLPAFPQAFFDSQQGRDWTMHIGGCDYLGPERMIAAWAHTNEIPVIPLGEVLQQEKMVVADIRSLYFLDGTGHLTVKGHAFCAQAIYEKFYQ